jgi:hypothetical protein
MSVHITYILLGYTRIIVDIIGSTLRACMPVHTYVDVVVNLINLLTCVVVVIVIIGGASSRNDPRGSVS